MRSLAALFCGNKWILAEALKAKNNVLFSALKFVAIFGINETKILRKMDNTRFDILRKAKHIFIVIYAKCNKRKPEIMMRNFFYISVFAVCKYTNNISNKKIKMYKNLTSKLPQEEAENASKNDAKNSPSPVADMFKIFFNVQATFDEFRRLHKCDKFCITDDAIPFIWCANGATFFVLDVTGKLTHRFDKRAGFEWSDVRGISADEMLAICEHIKNGFEYEGDVINVSIGYAMRGKNKTLRLLFHCVEMQYYTHVKTVGGFMSSFKPLTARDFGEKVQNFNPFNHKKQQAEHTACVLSLGNSAIMWAQKLGYSGGAPMTEKEVEEIFKEETEEARNMNK